MLKDQLFTASVRARTHVDKRVGRNALRSAGIAFLPVASLLAACQGTPVPSYAERSAIATVQAAETQMPRSEKPGEGITYTFFNQALALAMPADEFFTAYGDAAVPIVAENGTVLGLALRTSLAGALAINPPVVQNTIEGDPKIYIPDPSGNGVTAVQLGPIDAYNIQSGAEVKVVDIDAESVGPTTRVVLVGDRIIAQYELKETNSKMPEFTPSPVPDSLPEVVNGVRQPVKDFLDQLRRGGKTPRVVQGNGRDLPYLVFGNKEGGTMSSAEIAQLIDIARQAGYTVELNIGPGLVAAQSYSRTTNRNANEPPVLVIALNWGPNSPDMPVFRRGPSIPEPSNPGSLVVQTNMDFRAIPSGVKFDIITMHAQNPHKEEAMAIDAAQYLREGGTYRSFLGDDNAVIDLTKVIQAIRTGLSSNFDVKQTSISPEEYLQFYALDVSQISPLIYESEDILMIQIKLLAK